MSDLWSDSVRSANESVQLSYENIGHKLDSDGYAVCTDEDLGVDPAFRRHLIETYFDRELRTYPSDTPADRERARDVIKYAWSGPKVDISAHHTTALVDRGEPGVRDYHRIMSTDDPALVDWIRSALCLVPPHRRQSVGTLGINFFRTHTLVVTRPHRDEEEYVIIYVVDRHGGGAETSLHDPDSNEITVTVQLNPGDMLIFKDESFLHSVTPLDGQSNVDVHRDAVVATVDYPDSIKLV